MPDKKSRPESHAAALPTPAIHLSRTTAVWLLLLIATGSLWWLGFGHGEAGRGAGHAGIAALIVIAFVKIRLVASHFMQIRTAPWPLRLAFDGWILGVCAALLGIYWSGLS